MARKAMQLPDGRGTSVFDFPKEVCLSSKFTFGSCKDLSKLRHAELAVQHLQESSTQLRKLWKQTVNETAARLTPEQQEQLVQEHCKVFAFNNAIVGSFRVLPSDWPLAVFRTVQVLPLRMKILLGLLVMLCAWLATRFWSLLRSM
jgi:hypothetical protein